MPHFAALDASDTVVNVVALADPKHFSDTHYREHGAVKLVKCDRNAAKLGYKFKDGAFVAPEPAEPVKG